MANIVSDRDNCNIHHVAYRPKELLDDTLELEPVEKAAYHDLFMLVCLRGGPIRLELLQKTLGLHGRSLNALIHRLVDKGKIAVDANGLIDHFLARKVLENAVKTIRKLRENGAKGGRPKHLAKPNGYQSKTEGEALKNTDSESKPSEPPPPRARASGDVPEEVDKLVEGVLVGRCAPLARAARADGATLKAKRKELLRSKLFRFANDRLHGRQRTEAIAGLLGGDPDPEHNEQFWFDRLDRRMRVEGWQDHG